MAKHSRRKTAPFKAAPPARAGNRPLKRDPFGELNGKVILQALVILATGFWVFSPALFGDWIGDDRFYLPQNPLMQDPAGLWKIWFNPGSYFEYYPLEATALWMQWQLWGEDTFGYHLVTLLLHLLSALLVWRLFSKFKLKWAWLGGLLFVLHPAQVESVALISELKNTLSLPPFLLAMCAWIDYDEHGRKRDYRLALALFLVAMLCKISMALFPVILLLYAWWKRSKIAWSDLRACAPFFLVSLALGFTNILVADGYALRYPMTEGPVMLGGFLSRWACAGLSISFYVTHSLWPAGLFPFYAKWPVDPTYLPAFLPWIILGGVLFWCWTKRATWGRHVALGLGFFLINLTPFLGFNAISYMRFTWVMDHFLYIPLIGWIGLAVAGLGWAGERLSLPLRVSFFTIIAAILALLAFESHAYAGQFVNEETLQTYVLRYRPNDWRARTNLGNVYVQAGRDADAMEQYEQSLKINPDDIDAHNDLGNVLVQNGQYPEAIEQYQAVLRLNPHYAEAYNNLGVALTRMKRFDEAVTPYAQAVRINPQDVSAHVNLGNALLQAQRLPEAVDQYQQSVALDPNSADAHNNLGAALFRLGRLAEAQEQFQIALTLDPNDAHARANLAHLQASPPAAPPKN